MAKKQSYLKLGEDALSFYDANAKLKLTPGQVVEMTTKMKASKRIKAAVNAGHLEKADEDDYQEFLNGVDTKSEAVAQDVDDEMDNLTEKDLKKMKKPQLIEVAKFNEVDASDEDYDSLNKGEIIELLSDLDEVLKPE